MKGIIRKKLGTCALGALAALAIVLGTASTRADTIYLKAECRSYGHNVYSDLAYYHLYSYVAGHYLEHYFRNPKANAWALEHYYSYSQLAWSYLYYYSYGLRKLEACEKGTKKLTTITTTSTSVQTRTAANGAVITTTQVTTSVHTSTSR